MTRVCVMDYRVVFELDATILNANLIYASEAIQVCGNAAQFLDLLDSAQAAVGE